MIASVELSPPRQRRSGVSLSAWLSERPIVAAVAIEGFEELATALREAAHRSGDRRTALCNVATAYLGFTDKHPALYEAMFTMPTSLRFADADTKSELKAAFAALAAVVAPLERV